MNDGLGMIPTGIIREEGRGDRIKVMRDETLFITSPNNFFGFLDHNYLHTYQQFLHEVYTYLLLIFRSPIICIIFYS